MTAHDPSLHLQRQRRGILRWLGIEPVPAVAPAPGVASAAAPLAPTVAGLNRQQTLADIGQFLHAHDLPANAYTLTVAHDYLIGADPQMARLIDRQVRQDRPVTMEWLERAAVRSGRGSDAEMLDTLMAMLEASLAGFSQTASAAKSATRDYNTALERHVGELEQASKTGEVITELTTIARAMLDRTRDIQRAMNRSEMQTRSLTRSLEQARRSAEHDFLTGLPNRRAFEALLSREHAAARDAGAALCLAFCDIDNFKRVNDQHGHAAGDRVLKLVAQNLSRISGERCHVARHGGEEFVILLCGHSLEEAWELLDAMRREMADKRLVNRATEKPFGIVTFSGGVADVFAYADPRAALKAADEALYQAKEQGRNRIVMAGGPAPDAVGISG